MPDDDEIPQRASIVARLLSPFQLQVSGNTIRHWPNGKAKSVFKYLLLRRGHPAPRDKVMELADEPGHIAATLLGTGVAALRRRFGPVPYVGQALRGIEDATKQ